jgi:hypothetical protein
MFFYKTSTPISDELSLIETNNILDSIDNLPSSCAATLQLLDCMISSPKLSGDKEWINQYYLKLISEWNIITDKTTIENACTTQYNYIQWLQETWYQEIIQECNP